MSDQQARYTVRHNAGTFELIKLFKDVEDVLAVYPGSLDTDKTIKVRLEIKDSMRSINWVDPETGEAKSVDISHSGNPSVTDSFTVSHDSANTRKSWSDKGSDQPPLEIPSHPFKIDWRKD